MNWYQLSDETIIKTITDRILQKRLNENMTQKELAEKAGVHVNTIANFEKGNSTSLITLVQILRVFNGLDSLDSIFPDPGISPVELLKLKGKERERASGRKDKDENEPSW